MRSSKADPIDGAPFVVGVLTLLKQFHASCTEQFLAFLGQYVRYSISAAAAGDSRPDELPADVIGA